jgi:phosphoribosylformimino-5-aminoimidazole carboxamide ribotide isomerase
LRILPVIDLLGGAVVRGIAGRRRDYRPLVSPLCATSLPLDVARAFRAHFGLREVYLADLNAIGGHPPALAVFAALRDDGFRLWVDAGIRHAAQARQIAEVGAGIVVGLETLAGPHDLADILAEQGLGIILSLDLRAGVAITPFDPWKRLTPLEITAAVVALGVRRLLVLDLARVGVGTGTGTEELCAALAERHPDVAIIAGGGVRGRDDLLRLRSCRVRGALVASALHDGTLTRADVEDLDRPGEDGLDWSSAPRSGN